MSLNLAIMLRESRDAEPDKPLCVIGDLSFTYAQVDEISGRVAASLLGLGTGWDRMVIVARACPQLSQMTAAARWMAPRKWTARLS